MREREGGEGGKREGPCACHLPRFIHSSSIPAFVTLRREEERKRRERGREGATFSFLL